MGEGGIQDKNIFRMIDVAVRLPVFIRYLYHTFINFCIRKSSCFNNKMRCIFFNCASERNILSYWIMKKHRNIRVIRPTKKLHRRRRHRKTSQVIEFAHHAASETNQRVNHIEWTVFSLLAGCTYSKYSTRTILIDFINQWQ